MCGRDVNIEISETYQTGIFFSALCFSIEKIVSLYYGKDMIIEILKTQL